MLHALSPRFGVGCFALGLATLALSDAGEIRCSLDVLPGAYTGTAHHLLARPTADTLLAGSGPVEWKLAMGHAGRPTTRPVYGQVVRVEGIAGERAHELRTALDSSHGEVVLVPWDYGPDCTTTVWPRSFRWSEPGRLGFYFARPRDPSHWAAGRPTFDVHYALFEPYPHAGQPFGWRPQDRSADSFLTAEQLFALYRALPTQAQLRADPSDTARIGEWLNSHPDLASRFPAALVVHRAFAHAEQQRVRAIILPFRGTYRLTVLLPRADTLTLFLRTETHPRWGEGGRNTRWFDARNLESLRVGRSTRHTLYVYAATSLDAVPEHATQASTTPCLIGVMKADENFSKRGGTETWRAQLGPGFLASCFRSNQRWQDAARELLRLQRIQEIPEMQGLFRRFGDGRITFEQVIEREGTVLLTMRGAWISARTASVPR